LLIKYILVTNRRWIGFCRCISPIRKSTALALVLLLSARLASAAQLNVPINVDYLLLDSGIRQRFYTGPNGTAELWNGSDNCGHFRATNPRFSRSGSDVRLDTNGDLEAALALAGQCLNAMSWTGDLAATATPRIEDLQLKFHVTDLNFYTPEGAPIGGSAFELIKHTLTSELGSFSYDLHPYFEQLRDLPNRAPPSPAIDELKSVLNSLHPGPQVSANDDGVSFTLILDVPDTLIQAHPGELTPAQKSAWSAAASGVQDFLTRIGNQAQSVTADPQLRGELTSIIADIRSRAASAAPPPNGDPLPLFRDDWTRLRRALESAAHRGVLGAQTLPVLAGIAAGDAVFAIDQEAPGIGSRLARAGLSTLAGPTSRESM
jgi:hypothetical protein